VLQLEANSDCPDFLQLERRLWPTNLPLFQGTWGETAV
jgi:hypothetical protein